MGADAPSLDTRVTDLSELVTAMQGARVVGGGYDEPDGIHLELDDGRYLVITGVFVIGLCRVARETLQ